MALASICGCGCGHRDLLPFIGQWKANFVVDKIKEGGSDEDRRREGLRGFLQMYATHQSFKLHLEGEQEIFDAEGTWSHDGDRVVLSFSSNKIDDQGGAEKRNPNLKFIPPSDLSSAFTRDMALRLSKDKKSMVGLETSIGHLTGHHVFTRSTD
jgi:hypothetical protein